MKILGHSGLKPRTEKVKLGVSADDDSPIILELTAPRLNSITKLEEQLAPPDPPGEPAAPATGAVARDDRGRQITDDLGRPVVARNYKDPTYLLELKVHKAEMVEWDKVNDRYSRAQTMGMLLECLGGQVETDVKREDYEEWEGIGQRPIPRKGELVDYFDAVWDEFEEAGIDLVSLGRLSDAALRLTTVGDDEINDAKEALGASSGN